ncbi:T9SS type A sorting domain-containing protein [Flavobacterium sp.]|uniref:T9SS type A sorting domain-containing protein n=1 Tax=Flavobacterium sp. TaxID=239 RepID=UPI0035B33901
MKNHYFYLLLLAPLFIHSQDILWEKSYGGKNADYLFDAQPTADNGFILAGSSLSGKTGTKTASNNGDLDYWVWKMDANGKLDWQKSLGGSGFDLLQSIKGTQDGGFILAGTSSSNQGMDKQSDSKGLSDFWVVKLDAKGQELWQQTIGGSGQEDLLTVIPTRDGGYLLGGSSSSAKTIISTTSTLKTQSTAKEDLTLKTESTRGSMDYWIVKLDSKGNVMWQKTYGGRYSDLLRSLEQTKDGGFILGGYSNSPQSGDKTAASIGIGDYWIIKTDELGAIEWQNTYGGTGDNQLYVIHQTDDEGYIVGGNTNSPGSLTAKGGSVQSGSDFWLLRLDTKGEVVWSETYNYGKVDILTSLVENSDHSFLVGGYAQSERGIMAKGMIQKEATGINDYIALKVNTKGEAVWEKIVGSGGEDILRKLISTRDGGYLLAGTSNASSSGDKSTTLGSNDFWVVKLQDQLVPLTVQASIEAIPNPVSTFTNIIVGYEYETGTATVVDLAGRMLQQFTISSRTVPIDMSLYPEGIYVVNIKTNVKSEGIKVIKKTKKD